MPPRILLISGPRDSGKTRAATLLARRWRRRGLRVGGILSAATLSGGRKVSYSYAEIGSRRRTRYAVRRSGSGPRRTSAYDFLEAGLAFGREALRRAAAADVDVLIVDEIGPLELRGGGLWDAVASLAETFRGRLVLTVRPSLAARLRRRLGRRPAGDLEVLTPRQASRLP